MRIELLLKELAAFKGQRCTVQIGWPSSRFIDKIFTLSHTRQHPAFWAVMSVIDGQVQGLGRPLVLRHPFQATADEQKDNM